MLESLTSDKFEYQKLTIEEQTSRGILGRLVGVIADTVNPTRNGRAYKKALWEHVFEDPIMKERIETRSCFGELGHPADRTETDMSKVCMCLAEVPKFGADGKLYGVFDILPTPNGQILATLVKYGCNMGVSSRGSGDLVTDFDGQESVDPQSYVCEGWDAVLLPAVKEARMQFVTESLDTTKSKSLMEALRETVDNADEESRAIMETTIKGLHLEESDCVDKDCEKEHDKEKSEKPKRSRKAAKKINEVPADDKKSDDIKAVTEEVKEAGNSGDEVLEQLQAALKESKELRSQVLSLQDKLSAGYARECKIEEKCLTLKQTVAKLTENLKVSKAETTKLKSDSEIEKKELSTKVEEQINSLSSKNATLVRESAKLRAELENTKKKLSEQVSQQKILSESYNKDLEAEVQSLKEDLASAKKDLKIKSSEQVRTLESYKNEITRLKGIASKAVDRYISLQAKNLCVESVDIKKRLKENYSFNDIDRACEEMQSYKLNMSKLPFQLTEAVPTKVRANVITNEKKAGFNNPDDEIDDLLLHFLKK